MPVTTSFYPQAYGDPRSGAVAGNLPTLTASAAATTTYSDFVGALSNNAHLPGLYLSAVVENPNPLVLTALSLPTDIEPHVITPTEQQTSPRIWQMVASAYRPPNTPFALYAEDTLMGMLHAGTLAINFEPEINELTLLNPWAVDTWLGSYPLRIPSEERAATFPTLLSMEQVAAGIGYSLEVGTPPILAPAEVTDTDVPAWVQAYRDHLKNQIDVYGTIVKRNTRWSFL